MKYGFVFFVFLVLFCSCKKGVLTDGQRFSQVEIPFLLHDTLSLDLYVDGQLMQTVNMDRTGFAVTVPRSDTGLVTFAIKQTGSSETLIDTAIALSGQEFVLPAYVYSVALQLNKFVSANDFKRPLTADSIGFQFQNNIALGSGVVNISLVRCVQPYNYSNVFEETGVSIKVLEKGGLTTDTYILPLYNSNRETYYYYLKVTDAGSGEVYYAGEYIDWDAYVATPVQEGMIGQINTYTAGGGTYNLISLGNYVYTDAEFGIQEQFISAGVVFQY